MTTKSKFVADPAAAYQDLRGHVTTIIREWIFWVCMVFAILGVFLLASIATREWLVTALSIIGILYELYFVFVRKPPTKNPSVLKPSAALMLSFDPFERGAMLNQAQADFSTEGRILARVLHNYTFGKPWVSRRQGRLINSMLTTFKKRVVTCPHCNEQFDAVFDFTGSHNERVALFCPNGDPIVVTIMPNDNGVSVQAYDTIVTTRLANSAT